LSRASRSATTGQKTPLPTTFIGSDGNT
jgi:hypothetical protein